MSGRDTDDDQDVGAEIARAIRDLLGDEDRPLTREEAKEVDRLKRRMQRPPRQKLRELGRALARPRKPE